MTSSIESHHKSFAPDEPFVPEYPVISRAVTDRHYEKLLKMGATVALVLSAAFIPLFFFLEVPVMGMVNIGSVVLYAICLSLLNREEYTIATFVCWVELIGHAVLAVKVIGWDSGFHYYLLIFVPLIFANASNRLSLIVVKLIIISSIYVAIDLTLRTATPDVILDEKILTLMNYGNILIVFLFLGYVTFSYIQAVYEAEKQLVLYAITDPLTGLFNRRYIYQLGRYQEKLNKRSARPFSIIIADVDYFKSINDSFGHEAGDNVLVSLSRKLRDGLREEDSVARWGGEEFLILLPNTRSSEALMIAGRLGKIISSEPFRVGSDDIQLTMTFGVSEYDPAKGIDSCIASADEALIGGKNSGKNKIVSA